MAKISHAISIEYNLDQELDAVVKSRKAIMSDSNSSLYLVWFSLKSLWPKLSVYMCICSHMWQFVTDISAYFGHFSKIKGGELCKKKSFLIVIGCLN